MELLRRVERCMRRNGMAASTLGRRALRDPHLVRDLRRGRVPKPETEARLVAWLEEQEKGAGACRG